MSPLKVAVLLSALCAVAYGNLEQKRNSSRTLDCVNVYWRRFGKIIPVDAVVGGLDDDFNEIYVGRGVVIHDDRHQVIPLGINITAQHQLGPLIKPRIARNVEILCANPLSEVRWVKTNRHTFDDVLENEHPIAAGVDVNKFRIANIYIGRIWHLGQQLVGKVLVDNDLRAVLFYVDNGHVSKTYSEDFEILVANV